MKTSTPDSLTAGPIFKKPKLADLTSTLSNVVSCQNLQKMTPWAVAQAGATMEIATVVAMVAEVVATAEAAVAIATVVVVVVAEVVVAVVATMTVATVVAVAVAAVAGVVKAATVGVETTVAGEMVVAEATRSSTLQTSATSLVEVVEATEEATAIETATWMLVLPHSEAMEEVTAEATVEASAIEVVAEALAIGVVAEDLAIEVVVVATKRCIASKSPQASKLSHVVKPTLFTLVI